MIFMHTFWVVILVIGFIFLVTWLRKTRPVEQEQAAPSGASSVQILKQRYARGEIDQATFDQMRQDLMAD